MGWAVGWDSNWERDVGYGVPGVCDYPGCGAKITRGLAHVCGGEPMGGDAGCGLFFCSEHLGAGQRCERCIAGLRPFGATDDTPEWLEHKLSCPTWEPWRVAYPDEVAAIRKRLAERAPDGET